MANLIGKSSVDWKKTADFTGTWRLVEFDEGSFMKYFEAMGYPDTRAVLQFYKNAAQQEIFDKGDIFIIKYPDPSAEGGRREHVLTIGQEWVGEGPMGIKEKLFATREGNKLKLEASNDTSIYDLQGEKILLSKRHHGTGITASAVLVRDNSSL